MTSPKPHWLYFVCPKCSSVKEVKFHSESQVRPLKTFFAYCWNHDVKMQMEFVLSARTRQERNREELLDWGDKYVSIGREMWEQKKAAEGVSVDVNCPQCMGIILVSVEKIKQDGDHGTTVEAINCGDCNFANPIRIRGLFE